MKTSSLKFKLLMYISILLRGTSIHEKRGVSTFFLNITLHVGQHLTVISAAATSFPVANVEKHVEALVRFTHSD